MAVAIHSGRPVRGVEAMAERPDGTRMPFLAAAAISFANMLFGFFVLKESLTPDLRRPLDLKRANPVAALIQIRAFPIVFGIVTVMFINGLGHHVLPATWSFWGIEKFDWSPKEIGYSLGFVGIGMVLVQGFLIRWVVPSTGPRLAGIIGFGFSILAFTGYAFAGQVWVVYLALCFGALGGFASPAMQAIASGQISADRQGQLQGSISSMMSLTAIISPPIMAQTFGYFTDKSGYYFPGAAFLLSAILTVLALFMFMHYTRTLKNSSAT
jgi:DHA1 family tetracycline resistance protein-like MFS transporter